MMYRNKLIEETIQKNQLSLQKINESWKNNLKHEIESIEISADISKQ